MSTATETYKIFISSPSDVSQYRERIETIINNFSKNQFDNITYRVITQSDVISDREDYSQLRANNYLKDIDCYIGMMWLKAGTRTRKYESGTIEEYSETVIMSENTPLVVSFYFCNDPITPDKIDAKQLGKVEKFKKQIGGKQFYKTFSGNNELNDQITSFMMVLPRLIEEKKKKKFMNVEEAILDIHLKSSIGKNN